MEKSAYILILILLPIHMPLFAKEMTVGDPQCSVHRCSLYRTRGLNAKNLLRKRALWIGLSVKVFIGVTFKLTPE